MIFPKKVCKKFSYQNYFVVKSKLTIWSIFIRFMLFLAHFINFLQWKATVKVETSNLLQMFLALDLVTCNKIAKVHINRLLKNQFVALLAMLSFLNVTNLEIIDPSNATKYFIII